MESPVPVEKVICANVLVGGLYCPYHVSFETFSLVAIVTFSAVHLASSTGENVECPLYITKTVKISLNINVYVLSHLPTIKHSNAMFLVLLHSVLFLS